MPLTPGVPIYRDKVPRSRKVLEELADRLGTGDPVDACRVPQVRLLLSEGWGAGLRPPHSRRPDTSAPEGAAGIAAHGLVRDAHPALVGPVGPPG
jgi:hypothetical protein